MLCKSLRVRVDVTLLSASARVGAGESFNVELLRDKSLQLIYQRQIPSIDTPRSQLAILQGVGKGASMALPPHTVARRWKSAHVVPGIAVFKSKTEIQSARRAMRF